MFKKRNWRTAKPPENPDEETKPREINPEKARRKTFDRAVNLLAFKPRSIAELRERLLEKDWTNAEIVESVLDKLKEYNYLNDEQFAKSFAASKLRGKPMGKRVLKQKLALKKLDKETVEAAVESAFEETPETDLIEIAAAKRLRIKGKPATREDSKKFYDYLLRQGFSYDLVGDKMREINSRDLKKMNKINYDNRHFKSVSNSETGEVSGETVFHYHQKDALVWAEYAGGEIVFGNLIAKVSDDDSLEMRYQHLNKKGALMAGKCVSTPEILENGKIRLYEKWQWTSGDFSGGESVIEEISE